MERKRSELKGKVKEAGGEEKEGMKGWVHATWGQQEERESP